MNPKFKNIIIIVVVALVLILVYFFLIKKDPAEDALLTSSNTLSDNKASQAQESTLETDFISLLLSVKSIKLEDSIFSNKSFSFLKDSSIVLIQEGNEGRVNPFAPIGYESSTTSTSTVSPENVTTGPASAETSTDTNSQN